MDPDLFFLSCSEKNIIFIELINTKNILYSDQNIVNQLSFFFFIVFQRASLSSLKLKD